MQGGGSGEGKWASLSDNQASVELFYRLRNCRQTVDFARRQRAAFARLDKALLTIPQVPCFAQSPLSNCQLWRFPRDSPQSRAHIKPQIHHSKLLEGF